MINGIIFDLDGTLISEREYVLGCLKNTGDYIDRTYGTKEGYLKLKSLLEIKWDKLFDRYFLQEEIPYDESDIQKLIAIYRETTPEIKLYSDVIEFLERLKSKKIKLALLTNGYREIQQKKIEIADLKKFFDLIVIPDEAGREYWKPNKWGYDVILHKFDIQPEEIMAIGDMDHDFIVPKATGMRCVYIEREDRMKDLRQDVDPVRRIYSLKEIEMEV